MAANVSSLYFEAGRMLKFRRMKKIIQLSAMFAAAVFCFSGCGKNPAPPEKSAASYPLPEPPLVADCEPGNLGGRFIVSEVGDPKTFNLFHGK